MLLHPAVVHLPIALALFSPLLGFGLWRLCRAHPELGRLRILLVLWHLSLSAALYGAMFTGEMAEERPDFPGQAAVVDEHEGIAELFFLLSLAAIPLATFAAKAKGDLAPGLLVAYQILLTGMCVYTGYLGGQIAHGL